jgi:hypothetical protein
MDFYGINAKADITAESSPDIGTVGDPFGEMHGEATSAQWADLAEKYRTKGEHEKGTVMCVSKDPEIDIEPCDEDLSMACVGVISIRPGFKMNDALYNGQFVGLTGLLPVKVIGSIEKSDFIVPTKDGCARVGKPEEFAYKIGIANETKTDEGIKLVECIIK